MCSRSCRRTFPDAANAGARNLQTLTHGHDISWPYATMHEPLAMKICQHADGGLKHLACLLRSEWPDWNHLRQTFVGILHHQVNERRIASLPATQGENPHQMAMGQF